MSNAATVKKNIHLDKILIQKYYFQKTQKQCTQSKFPQLMQKVLEKPYSWQEEEKSVSQKTGHCL